MFPCLVPSERFVAAQTPPTACPADPLEEQAGYRRMIAKECTTIALARVPTEEAYAYL